MIWPSRELYLCQVLHGSIWSCGLHLSFENLSVLRKLRLIHKCDYCIQLISLRLSYAALNWITLLIGPKLIALGSATLLGPTSTYYHRHILLYYHLPKVIGRLRQWGLGSQLSSCFRTSGQSHRTWICCSQNSSLCIDRALLVPLHSKAVPMIWNKWRCHCICLVSRACHSGSLCFLLLHPHRTFTRGTGIRALRHRIVCQSSTVDLSMFGFLQIAPYPRSLLLYTSCHSLYRFEA